MPVVTTPNAMNDPTGIKDEFTSLPTTEEILSFNPSLLTQLNQQNDTPEDALSMLKQMSKEDPAYKELYVKLLAERENQERAYKWYEDFNKTYYQRTTKDLQKAGLNPWLALQSLGSSGTGSLSAAGTGSVSSGSTIAAQRQANNSQIAGRAIAAFAAIIGALIFAMA